MILKFPRPYPDETFYSWIARYHERSANYHAKTTVEAIFDAHYGCAVHNLPTGIEKFCTQLEPLIKYNPEQIIQYHTSLPYYSSVFPKQRINTAKIKMLADFNAGIHGLLGMQASVVSEFRYLRYCPDCLQEDIRNFGEPYWHRTHQLPGVLVCPLHHVPTINSLVDKHNIHTQLYASAKAYAKPNLVQKHIEPNEKLINIAAESQKLLSKYYRITTSNRYRTLILNAGFTKGSLIDQVRLAESFLEFWPQALLTELGVSANLTNEDSWLKFMTRRTRQGLKAHPLQHILLRLFLKELPSATPESKTTDIVTTSFPCPNPFCTEADPHSAVIEKTYRHSKSGPLFGVISCVCGYSFSCDVRAKYLYTRNVIEYGQAWESKFIDYVQQGHSIHKLEQLMSVSRPVIKKKALALKLAPKWLSQAQINKKNKGILEQRAQKHKAKFLSYRKRYPEYSLKQLRSKINSSIKFLYRYNREWLDQYRPANQKTVKPQRINWKKRDQEYLKKAQSIVSELIKMPGKPQKITPSKVSKILGQKNIFTKIPDKIPLTMAFLTEACNQDEYITRTFNWAAQKLRIKGQSLTRAKIIKQASIRYTPSEQHEDLLYQLSSSPYEAPSQQVENRSGQNPSPS